MYSACPLLVSNISIVKYVTVYDLTWPVTMSAKGLCLVERVIRRALTCIDFMIIKRAL